MASERAPGELRRTPPTVQHMLDVLSAAAVGDLQARVDVEHDQRSHPHELLGNAINVLLSDLGQDVADTRAVLAREAAGRARHDFADLIATEVRAAREMLTGVEATAGLPESISRVPLARLRSSLDSLAAGLEEMRELTEIELGRTLLREQPVRIRPLIEDSLRRTADRVGGAAVETAISVASDVPDMLLGDPLRLSLIVDRMLEVLAPEAGPVMLGLDVGATPASDGWYVLRIEASARPVPAPPPEPGLRLAIVGGLAEALGGQLELNADAGTATLIAPLAAPAGA